MTEREQADAVVETMLAGGWNHESVFKAPAEAISDWLRDHGRDDLADAVLDVAVTARVRDKCWLDAGGGHKAAMREHVRRVTEWLNEQAKWVVGTEVGVHAVMPAEPSVYLDPVPYDLGTLPVFQSPNEWPLIDATPWTPRDHGPWLPDDVPVTPWWPVPMEPGLDTRPDYMYRPGRGNLPGWYGTTRWPSESDGRTA